MSRYECEDEDFEINEDNETVTIDIFRGKKDNTYLTLTFDQILMLAESIQRG